MYITICEDISNKKKRKSLAQNKQQHSYYCGSNKNHLTFCTYEKSIFIFHAHRNLCTT